MLLEPPTRRMTVIGSKALVNNIPPVRLMCAHPEREGLGKEILR